MPSPNRRIHRVLTLLVLALGATTVAAACTPGLPTTGSPLGGTLTTRTVTVTVTGAGIPLAVDSATGVGTSGIGLEYNGSSAVIAAGGALHYERDGGATGRVTVSLAAGLRGMEGSISVLDSGGTNVSVGGVASFAADDHGNISTSITQGPVTVSVSTGSIGAPTGSDPALEALLANETDFCAEAQQLLAGLDPAEVPIDSIINTRETPRAAFAESKTVVDPLTVRTWTDSIDVDSEAGLATISEHISCKLRAADHVATTGVSTGPADLACSALNQRSIDLALAQMTPEQQAAVTVPTLGTDVVVQKGIDWTTPLPNTVEFDGTTLRGHGLLVTWNDPAFSLFPATIRGVHYCTVWSPAFAYTHLVDTLA